MMTEEEFNGIENGDTRYVNFLNQLNNEQIEYLKREKERIKKHLVGGFLSSSPSATTSTTPTSAAAIAVVVVAVAAAITTSVAATAEAVAVVVETEQ